MDEQKCAAPERERRVGISLTEEAWGRLMHLVCLGNYVVNGWRLPREELAEYNAVAETMYRRHYGAAAGIAEADAEENEIADVRDRLGGETEAYLAAFEADVLRCGAGGAEKS